MNFRSHAIDEGELGIELTPLIDVVFLLLIFFMVSSTFKDEAQLALVLPESAADAASPNPQSIEVVISAEGLYHIGGELAGQDAAAGAEIEELKQLLNKAAVGQKEPAIVIAADKNASHGAVVKLLEAARQLNFLKISFTAERSHGSE